LVKLAEGEEQTAPWHTNATYRAEAVISTTYALMLMAVTEGKEAEKLQSGTRIDKFLRKRFEDGFRRAKKITGENIPRHLRKTKAEEKEIIRHIPYHDSRGTLDEIIDRLTIKRAS
jgi:3-oxoacyl-[acyl-carrier-protein] synthase III